MNGQAAGPKALDTKRKSSAGKQEFNNHTDFKTQWKK
jgi:hypothetical protein